MLAAGPVRGLAVLAAYVVLPMTVTLLAASSVPACVGDCNSGGEVSVDELLRGVRIALGTAPIEECPRLDSSGDGAVTINELLAAVHAAVNGCPQNQAPLLACFGLYRTYAGFEIQLPIGAVDPDADALLYSATDLPDGAVLDESSGVFTWTPTAQQVGAFYIPFAVTDAGAPPLATDGVLSFRVAPMDHCIEATCDPATGCEATLLPLSQPCCLDVPPRLVEPAVVCPAGRGLSVGRNLLGGVGRLSNCDRLQVNNSGQSSATVRFNLEARCLDVQKPVNVRARMFTGTRLVFDNELTVALQPRGDGAAQVLGLNIPVQTSGPFFDLEDADADLSVTVTDVDGVAVTARLRPTLTFRRPDDLEDLNAPRPDSLGSCE